MQLALVQGIDCPEQTLCLDQYIIVEEGCTTLLTATRSRILVGGRSRLICLPMILSCCIIERPEQWFFNEDQNESAWLPNANQVLMKTAMRQLQLTARAYHRVPKLSRTIGHLAGAEAIT